MIDYRFGLGAANVAGRVTGLRYLTPGALRFGCFMLGVGGIVTAFLLDIPAFALFPAAMVFASVLEARSAARKRVVIGEFSGLEESESTESLRVAELLRVELARLSDLFQTVEDRRAVSSGAGPKNVLDATLSVDSVANHLQAAVSSESKVKVGPLSFPVRGVIALGDRIVRPPRITGSLHADASGLIITAQQEGLRGLSWRVPPERGETGPTGPDPRLSSVSSASGELALRIFTDLALGRHVRWEASRFFVMGLDRVRACLRAPTDRKVNLRKAEEYFLKTLSEDEDFPQAYYNLGVVYKELFTLALKAGRAVEAENHLRAAGLSFGEAVERDPARWENYFALAQTEYENCRFPVVVQLCERMLDLKLTIVKRAKVHELYASALLAARGLDHAKRANAQARRAARYSVLAVSASRVCPNFFTVDDELAAACLQTYGEAQTSYASSPDAPAWARARSVYEQAARLTHQSAELYLELALIALAGRNVPLALEASARALRADPSRPIFLAARAAALAVSSGGEAGGAEHAEPKETVVDLCRRAVQSMCRGYAPARDADACDLIAKAYCEFKDESLRTTSEQLCKVRDEASRRLAQPVTQVGDESRRLTPERERDGGATVSAAFMQALRLSTVADTFLDEFGQAVKEAQEALEAIRGESEDADLRKIPRPELQQKALDAAKRAASLNPLSVLAWVTLGDVHQEFSDFAHAREAWTNAQTQDPDNPALYDRIGASWWHLAFEVRSGASRSSLEEAKDLFVKALILYEAGTLEVQIRTRYRLGKLYATLGDFESSMAQLRIVEAAGHVPLVGWVLLGLSYLADRRFAECEHFFTKVIEAGAELDSGERLRRQEDGSVDPRWRSNERPAAPLIEKIDERYWPLGLTRAWGYCGLALSLVERDGNLAKAEELIESARELARSADLREDPERYPTRIEQACDDCEGQILFKRGSADEAAEVLERATGRHPFSRSYLHLARVYLELGRQHAPDRQGYVDGAKRCVSHARHLASEATAEADEILAEAESLVTV